MLSFNSIFASSSNYFFIENKGQWPSDVLFKADIPGGYLFVKETGLTYLFYDSKAISEAHFSKKEKDNLKKKAFSIAKHSVFLDFKNPSEHVKVESLRKQEQVINFFYGDDESKLINGASAFE